jgi:hypothetical protein
MSISSAEGSDNEGRFSTPQKRKMKYNFWDSDSDSDDESSAGKKLTLTPPAHERIDKLVTGN